MKNAPQNIPHNLYLYHVNSAYRNHVYFKKHLTENSEAFEKYRNLKISLVDSEISRDEYWRSKTSLILELLEK